ncbi:MAG: hypothetical protein DWQ34_25435 [Planctomycetota bacterium]|mgnify:CR=1 FL=1|nr:MAG: hypothetical protein DWQ34_25435 [Planctomycetota bacterium]REK25878.1 MAG: hypothetical protein DWQ41_11205 [Planctomycetota bacterium]REK37157.1 MAG: hypothetical protein DWQ45_08015 [Planctomycetota bacterium]
MPFLAPLDDFKSADMPERSAGFWKLAGPGAVLVGLSIGAGEIVIWPTIVAEHGAGMVWAAVIGVFLQLWINFEVARWTIATGETVYTGFARVWRGFAVVFILLNIMGWLAPGWAMASGSALKALLFGPDFGAGAVWGSMTLWTSFTFGIVLLLLFGPKLVYNSVEKTIEILILTVTIGLILVAFFVSTADTWAELGRGAVNFGYKSPGFPFKSLFIALVFAGAGGTANLFYTFYLRDKNVGMGARIPELSNPLRGRTEAVPSTGFHFDDTPENAERFRSWWRYIRQDQTLFFWLLNSVTLMLFIFGALAVLHPRGIVPQADSLIWDESQILAEVWGQWGANWGKVGRSIFLMVGVATLFSTQLALVDGVSRSISDIIYTNVAAARKRELNWWYMVIALGWIAVGLAITAVIEFSGIVKDLGVLFNAAYMGGFAMAVYVPLTLYMNLRYLPKSARPGPVSIGMMVIATITYTGFALYCIYWEITQRL